MDEQPTQPTETELSQPKKSSALLYSLIFLLIGVLIGGGAIFAIENRQVSNLNNQLAAATSTPALQTTTPSPTPTSTVSASASASPIANKTYTNTTDHYTLSYPGSWNIETLSNADPATVPASFTAPCSYATGEACLTISTTVDVGTWSGSLDSYVTSTLQASSPTATRTLTTLGGLPAVQIMYPADTVPQADGSKDSVYKVATIALRNNKGFTITATEVTKSGVPVTGFQNMTSYLALIKSLSFN